MLSPLRLPLLAAAALALSGCVGMYDDGYGAGFPAYPQAGHGGYGYPQGGYGGYPGELRVRSVQDFYGPLSRYGSWRGLDRFGRVWVPSVGAGWRPYTIGRWDPSRRWISDEPFGWATYHYGRWGFDRRVGWFWVPDTRWGPAWVDWRDAGDHWGWSPLSPYGWDGGYGASVGFGWTFAPRRSFHAPGIHRYVVPAWQVAPLYRRSRQPSWGYGGGGWRDDGGRRGAWRDGRDPRWGRPEWQARPPIARVPGQRPPLTGDADTDARVDRGLGRVFGRGDRRGDGGGRELRGTSVDMQAQQRGWPAPADPVRSATVATPAPPQAPVGAPAWQPPAGGGFARPAQADRPEPRPNVRADGIRGARGDGGGRERPD